MCQTIGFFFLTNEVGVFFFLDTSVTLIWVETYYAFIMPACPCVVLHSFDIVWDCLGATKLFHAKSG